MKKKIEKYCLMLKINSSDLVEKHKITNMYSQRFFPQNYRETINLIFINGKIIGDEIVH
jgi:hypothetical protein